MISLPSILPIETIVVDQKDSRILKVHGSCPVERLWTILKPPDRPVVPFGFRQPDVDSPMPDDRISDRSLISMDTQRVFRQVCAGVSVGHSGITSHHIQPPEMTPEDFFLDYSASHISRSKRKYRRSMVDAMWLFVTIPIEPVFRPGDEESFPPPLPLGVELSCEVKAKNGGYDIELDAVANERVGIDILAVYEGYRGRRRRRRPLSNEDPDIVFVGYFEIGCTHGKDDPRKSVKFNLPPSPLGRLLELRLRPFRIATVHLQGYYADQPEPQLRPSVRPSEASFDVESSSFGAPYLLFTETQKLNIQDIAIPGEKIVICRTGSEEGGVQGIRSCHCPPPREFGYLYGTKTFHIPLQFDFLLRFDVPATCPNASNPWLELRDLKMILIPHDESLRASCVGVRPGIEGSGKFGNIVDRSEIVEVRVKTEDLDDLLRVLDRVNSILLIYSQNAGQSFQFPTTSALDTEEIAIRSRRIVTVSDYLDEVHLIPNWPDLLRSYGLFRRSLQFLYRLTYAILEKSALLVKKNPLRAGYRNILEIDQELQRLRRDDAPETTQARQREIRLVLDLAERYQRRPLLRRDQKPNILGVVRAHPTSDLRSRQPELK